MRLSQEVQRILERSSTLSERLSNQFLPDSTNSLEIEQRLKRWQQVVCRNEVAFHNRLKWDSLALDTLRPKLGSVRWQGETPPSWTAILEEIFAIAKQNEQIEIYQLFTKVARQELSKQIEELSVLISNAAYRHLEANLVERLIALCNRIISSFSYSATRYETLLNLFEEYSVLARLVATIIEGWVRQVSQFFQALAEDLPQLRLLYQSPLEQVVAVKLREASGCQRNFIAIVTFNCGLKLVYKSSPLGIQSAYENLLLWLNRSQTLPLEFKTLKILKRDRGGWVEYVEHQSCTDEAAVKRYYQRSGMLLALVYALSGIDCHYANLIACGEYPILIDTETLLRPRLSDIPNLGELSDAEMQAHDAFVENSVIQTGFLPVWKVLSNYRILDESSLGGTDSIDRHRPILNGNPVALIDYESEVVQGFQQMYCFLLDQRDVLLSQDSPWMDLTRHPVRFLFRSNRIYEAVLRRSLQPEVLRQGIDRSIELEILSRAFLAQGDKPAYWEVFHAEINAIEQVELPHFRVFSDQTDLIYNNAAIVRSYFEQSSSETAKNRLSQLSQQDLEQQIQWIRGSIYAYQVQPNCDSKVFPNCTSSSSSFTSDRAIYWAVRIAERLQQQAIYGADGSITWIGLTSLARVQKFQLQPIDDSLFQGSCGIALFLGALAKLTHDSLWQELARSTIQPLCQRLQFTIKTPNNPWIRRMTSTKTTEFGGYIYSLTQLSQFLDQPDLLQIATLAASHINADFSEFGLLHGMSGVMLGLLSLYEATHTPSFLNQACECGERLLNKKSSEHSGFADGRSGIAYALLKLFSISRDLRFLEGAKSIFSTIAFSEFDRPDWAQGTTGIGLGCIGSLPFLDTSNVRRLIDSALLRLESVNGWRGVDHLYGGNFGRLELLLCAAETMEQPFLYQLAQDHAAELLDRAEQRNNFYLCPHRSSDILHPGFFQGLTGIGYLLLRLASPKEIPSVLLWK